MKVKHNYNYLYPNKPVLMSPQRSLDFHESREAEPHPLWEYPCRALTQSTAAMTFDFTQCLPQQPISTQGSLSFIRYSYFNQCQNSFETHGKADILH